MALRRFWFEFQQLPTPTALNLGCGVTAWSYDDALALLRERVFGASAPPAIERCVEDVDMSCIEDRHVLPNIGNVLVRALSSRTNAH